MLQGLPSVFKVSQRNVPNPFNATGPDTALTVPQSSSIGGGSKSRIS